MKKIPINVGDTRRNENTPNDLFEGWSFAPTARKPKTLTNEDGECIGETYAKVPTLPPCQDVDVEPSQFCGSCDPDSEGFAAFTAWMAKSANNVTGGMSPYCDGVQIAERANAEMAKFND